MFLFIPVLLSLLTIGGICFAGFQANAQQSHHIIGYHDNKFIVSYMFTQLIQISIIQCDGVTGFQSSARDRHDAYHCVVVLHIHSYMINNSRARSRFRSTDRNTSFFPIVILAHQHPPHTIM